MHIIYNYGTRGGREMNLATNAPSLRRSMADASNTTALGNSICYLLLCGQVVQEEGER